MNNIVSTTPPPASRKNVFILAEVQTCPSPCQCRVSQAFLKPLFIVSLPVWRAELTPHPPVVEAHLEKLL